MSASPLYSFEVSDIEGKPYPMADLKGKVVLVVNVASKCGFTGQYKGLEELYQKHKDNGFVILGFPCNQFGGQEPGAEAEIASFCSLKYNVSFPMMKKIEVNGNDTHPLYSWLKSQKQSMMMEAIKWNFEKFLIGRDGQPVERFTSVADPISTIDSHVVKALAQQC